MSSTIKQAIQALKSRIADAYTAIVAKGGTLPATQDSANLPAAIASIPSGSTIDPFRYIVEHTTDGSRADFSRKFAGMRTLDRDIDISGLTIYASSMYAVFNGTRPLHIFNLENCNTTWVTDWRLAFYVTGKAKVNLVGCDFSATRYISDLIDYGSFYNTLIGDYTEEDVRNGVTVLNGLTVSISFRINNLDFRNMLAICKGVGIATSAVLTFKAANYNSLTASQQAELDAAISGKNWTIATA